MHNIHLLSSSMTIVSNKLFKIEIFAQNSPSSLSGIFRPSYPITLVLILFRSSMDNSPFHILFSICPYNGSSLKRWSLSNMMIALMQLSQCPLDLLENRSSLSLLPTGLSCQKSPANMIEIPPKGWFLFPMSFSFLSSVRKILSLMNDISSIMRICTSCHSFLSSRLSGLR